MFYTQFIKLCEKEGIKPTPLLKSLGLSATNLKRWENGATVNSDILIKISEYFDVSIDYLLKGEEQNAVNINGSSNNTNIGENAVMNVPYSNLDKHDKEILEEYNKLSLKNKAKVISYMTELEDTAEE